MPRIGENKKSSVPDVVDSAPEIHCSHQKRPTIFVKYHLGFRAPLLLPLFFGTFALKEQRGSRNNETGCRCNERNPYACFHRSQITPPRLGGTLVVARLWAVRRASSVSAPFAWTPR